MTEEPVELTEEEKAGVKAIIFLQSMAGIEDTPADALAGWRGMDEGEKNSTMFVYGMFKHRN